MNRFVDISFDCLPLRSVTRLDIPIDASPKYQALCERIKQAIATHGTHNTYYLYNAGCTFHLTNNPDLGTIEFSFEGTVMTDPSDRQTDHCHLDVRLERETCDWLIEPVVAWLQESVQQAVKVEFDRYIEAGDLAQTIERIRRQQAQTDASGGFVGMYL
ncbi:MAG TPA: hypothetical protein VHY91_03565 [Pirellulales bacterium]|jgi:hypothetical protein|nr:hypothetical protein [Pirellulales bacterium]